MNSYSAKIDKSKVLELEKILEADGALFLKPQYTYFQAKINNITATFYLSGKVVVQGKNVENFVSKYLTEETQIALFSSTDVLANLSYPHIGIDESGKGDFFGPLVIAGVLLDKNGAELCEKSGIKDSKKLDDKKIIELAKIIKENFAHNVVIIGNARYNELYLQFKNLNKLLAWGHATVLENILKQQNCELAISDKFGNENFILSSLKTRGRQIKLIQETKAERDLSVAAASILARYEFIKSISNLCQKYEINFPKGASNLVVNTGKTFVKKYGFEELKHVAKLNFKTTLAIK